MEMNLTSTLLQKVMLCSSLHT